MRRSSSFAATLLLAVPLGAPGSAAAGQQLAYAVPSPATATYLLTDNTSMSVSGGPMGPIELGGASTFNYALTFAADGEGVRVSAELNAWVDTVTVGVGEGGERVVVYTYTLEGEATHDGRPHLRIAVSGESRMSLAAQGMSMNLTGSESGYYLWDMERGLMASAEMSRSNEGGMTGPDGDLGHHLVQRDDPTHAGELT